MEKKQGGITSEGAMAPPNTPGKITPVFVHSGFHATKRSTHVPDGLSGTKRQIMSSEMMQPLTAYGYMPAPADSWSCQQPATIIHASPAQAPMAAGPYPTPIRQFQPAPYGMPTPADSWSCQQPATIIHASPAQAPMAAGPYPTPIRQFQPAPYGMPAPADSWSCQQPATVTHASPANQTSMAAGPYPTPIRQFQPAPYGMPAPADSWSCQQPATVIHASPATQAPMAAGPYPTPIQQFQPAPYGMPAPADSWSCQQPATVIHASPATQAPMAAGPYPTPIQQPLPTAPHDMPTFADQWSYQQPGAVPYCSMTQSPATIGPNPVLIPQPLPPAHGTSEDSQHPMPAMVSHFPVYAHTQTRPSRQLPVCGLVQSQRPANDAAIVFISPAMPYEFSPEYASGGDVQQLSGDLAESTGQTMSYGPQLPIQGGEYQESSFVLASNAEASALAPQDDV